MLLQETKQVALNTTETLANQTNQIGNMKGDLEEVDNKLKRSEQVGDFSLNLKSSWSALI